ncbi:hypothetical protein TWF696_004740 [Orbilia brochopaga]|uniref:Uncharacterized protein n=1 Tax=Orbilia brochopaga TaxID=3140254 RepID=A0AAV9V1X5_9PEZI
MSNTENASGPTPFNKKRGNDNPNDKFIYRPPHLQVRGKATTFNPTSPSSSTTYPPSPSTPTRRENKMGSTDKHAKAFQRSNNWRIRDTTDLSPSTRMSTPPSGHASGRVRDVLSHPRVTEPESPSRSRTRQRQQLMITYPGVPRDQTGALRSPLKSPSKAEHFDSPGLSTTLHGSEIDPSRETSFQSSSTRPFDGPRSRLPLPTTKEGDAGRRNARPLIGVLKKIHSAKPIIPKNVHVETAALKKDTRSVAVKAWLTEPSGPAESERKREEENKRDPVPGNNVQQPTQDNSILPLPSDRIILDFGLDSLFSDFHNMALENKQIKSPQAQANVGSAMANADKETPIEMSEVSSGDTLPIDIAVKEILDDSLADWGSISIDEAQKRWHNSKDSWRSALKHLNAQVYGYNQRNRCLNDKEIPELLGLLEILSHEYHIQCEKLTSQSTENLEIIRVALSDCLITFASEHHTHNRIQQFLDVKARMEAWRKQVWEQGFRNAWETLGSEFREAVTRGAVMRNYYDPLSGRFANICEIDGDVHTRSHRTLRGYRIDIDGTVTVMKQDPGELEYVWAESQSPVSSPPASPPTESPFRKGIKFDCNWFNENGEFTISENVFSLVDAKSRPQKKKSDDESLLIIDTSFVAAMDQYIEEFAAMVGTIVREAALENIDLQASHFVTICSKLEATLKSRFALNENDTLNGIASLSGMELINAIWDQLSRMHTAACRPVGIQPYVTGLARKLSVHLTLVYSELQEKNKTIIETPGSATMAEIETQGPGTHTAASLPAILEGDFQTVMSDEQGTMALIEQSKDDDPDLRDPTDKGPAD